MRKTFRTVQLTRRVDVDLENINNSSFDYCVAAMPNHRISSFQVVAGEKCLSDHTALKTT